MKKKWSLYQVDGPQYKTVKTVAELTETEAKNELCLAIDKLEKLDAITARMSEEIEKWRKGLK